MAGGNAASAVGEGAKFGVRFYFFWLLYNVLLHSIFSAFWLPALAVREFRARFLNRLGFRLPRPRRSIWLHAPSVGEALSIRAFVAQLRDRFPDYEIVLTTFTSGGRHVAKQVNADHHLALPYDLLPSVALTVASLKPALCLIVEGDLWPNLIWYLRKRGVPVAVVNGRISEKALSRYRRLGPFARPLFENINAYCIAGADYTPRYLEMGVPGPNLVVTGNLKYDNLDVGERTDVIGLVKEALGGAGRDDVLIAASTHAGEEEIVADAFLSLRPTRPSLKLLVAPRYVDRAAAVAEALRKRGLATELRSRLPRGGVFDAVVLDTLGELSGVYPLGAVAFIGGSFIPRGGQNMMEAAYHGCVTLWGPHVENFPVETAKLAGRGGIAVSAEDDLERALEDIYRNDDVRAVLGTEAAAAAREMMGASARTLTVVTQLAPGGGA